MTGAGLYEILATLADDVLAALAAEGGAPPCRVLVAPYLEIADDYCCDTGGCAGQLAVTLDQLFRSTSFPIPEGLGFPTPCGCGGDPVAIVRARITRCVPSLTDAGGVPTVEALSGSAAEALVDASALSAGVCAFVARFPKDNGVPGIVLPVGPLGGCGSYEVTATVAPDEFVPPEES